MAKRHELSLVSAQSLNPEVWTPSWDSTTPPDGDGSTQTDTVKSALVVNAGPAVDSAPVPPPPGALLRMTSGSYRSPECQSASPLPETGRVPTAAAAVPAVPVRVSLSAHACVGLSSVWGACAAIVAGFPLAGTVGPHPRPGRARPPAHKNRRPVYGAVVPAPRAHRSGLPLLSTSAACRVRLCPVFHPVVATVYWV